MAPSKLADFHPQQLCLRHAFRHAHTARPGFTPVNVLVLGRYFLQSLVQWLQRYRSFHGMLLSDAAGATLLAEDDSAVTMRGIQDPHRRNAYVHFSKFRDGSALSSGLGRRIFVRPRCRFATAGKDYCQQNTAKHGVAFFENRLGRH
jgi:hypothetical protein